MQWIPSLDYTYEILKQTSFCCPDGDGSSVWASIDCECLNGAVVDIEGMKQAYSDLCGGIICHQLPQDAGLSLSDVDPVLPEDPIEVLHEWGAPVQEDVGGI